MPTDSARARRSWMPRWTSSPRRAISAPASATSRPPSACARAPCTTTSRARTRCSRRCFWPTRIPRWSAWSSLAEERITDVRVFLEQLVVEAFQSFLQPRQQQLFRIMMSDGIRLARAGRINLFERLGDRRERMEVIMRRLIREGWLRAADPQVLAMSFAAPLFMCRHLQAIDADLPHAPRSPRNSPASTSSSSFAAPRRPLSNPKRRPAAPPRDRARRNAARVARVNPYDHHEHPLRPPSWGPLDHRPVPGAAGKCVHPRQRRSGGARRGRGRLREPHDGGRAARHPIHPCQRHAHRRGRRGCGRRDSRPRYRHPCRAGHPRERRRGSRAHCRGRSRGAGPGSAGQCRRRSRHGSASPTAPPSTPSACRKWRTPRPHMSLAQTDFEPRQDAARADSCSRSPSTTSAARRLTQRQRQYDVATQQRRATVSVADGRQGSRRRGAEGAGRHRRARAVCGRGGRAASCRLATTSRAAPRSPR